jgi:hypothetical protein
MRRVIGIQSDGDGDPRDEDSKFNESREIEKLAVDRVASRSKTSRPLGYTGSIG